MAPDVLFQIANNLAVFGWLALLASPVTPVWSQRVAGGAIPLLLSVAYAGLALAFFADAEGGFGDLEGVMTLFKTPEIVVAGWIHYLAFDLFVGAWIVRAARREEIWFLLIVPCLALTLFAGPAGFLAFMAIRMARGGLEKAAP